MVSSYNARTNVSRIKKGIISSMNVHSMRKREVLSYSCVQIRKAINSFEVNVNVQKEPPKV